jgi:hypothetical protein
VDLSPTDARQHEPIRPEPSGSGRAIGYVAAILLALLWVGQWPLYIYGELAGVPDPDHNGLDANEILNSLVPGLGWIVLIAVFVAWAIVLIGPGLRSATSEEEETRSTDPRP